MSLLAEKHQRKTALHHHETETFPYPFCRAPRQLKLSPETQLQPFASSGILSPASTIRSYSDNAVQKGCLLIVYLICLNH